MACAHSFWPVRLCSPGAGACVGSGGLASSYGPQLCVGGAEGLGWEEEDPCGVTAAKGGQCGLGNREHVSAARCSFRPPAPGFSKLLHKSHLVSQLFCEVDTGITFIPVRLVRKSTTSHEQSRT